MIPFIKSFAGDKKNLAINFLSLLIVQGANYILPLLTIPYVFRIVGAEKFGVIALSQAVAQYFMIFTEFGLNSSSVRELSINRSDKSKVNEVFCSVMILKALFTVICFCCLCAIVYCFPKFREEFWVYIFAYGMVAGEALFPIWYFQGMEKMKYITFFNILTKVIFTFTIFMFVKTTSDYVYCPLLYSLGYIVSGLLSLIFLLSKFDVKLKFPPKVVIKNMLFTASHFFLFRLSASAYTLANTLFLGVFTNNAITGYYAAAEKLIRPVLSLNEPVASALYPYMSRTANKALFKKIFYAWILVAVVIFMVLFFCGDIIIELVFGKGKTVTANVFKLLSFDVLIAYPAMMLGMPFLIALGYLRYVTLSFVVGGIIHIAGLLCVIHFCNIYMVVIMTLITETVILSVRLYGIKKNKLWVTQ